MASAPVALGHGLVATIQFDDKIYPGWNPYKDPYENPYENPVPLSIQVRARVMTSRSEH